MTAARQGIESALGASAAGGAGRPGGGRGAAVAPGNKGGTACWGGPHRWNGSIARHSSARL